MKEDAILFVANPVKIGYNIIIKRGGLRMNRVFQRVTLICLILLLVVSVYPVSAVDQIPEAEYYGEAYQELKTEEQKAAYRLLEEGVASLSPLITFEGIVEIKYGQIPDVLRAVCVDNPQYFWFLEGGKCNYSKVDYGNLSPVISFEPYYILDGKKVSTGSQELADAMREFHSVVRKIVNEIPKNVDTEYEIALYLHDYLAQHVTYTLEGEHPSAYAALVHGEAACYGYSKAYQCLLNAAGIRARTITGDSPDENGKMIGHAWNQVWLDGKCLYVDVTWDDLEDVIVHNYFACSLETISTEHFADQDFVFPDCNHEDMLVYSKAVLPGVTQWTEQTTARDAAGSFCLKTMEKGSAIFTCEVEFTGSNFLGWFRKCSDDIFDHLGISNSASVYYYDLGKVYQLTITDSFYPTGEPEINTIHLEDTQVVLPGIGTRYQLRPQIEALSSWTPLPIYTSSDTSVAVVNLQGMITAVGEGNAVITVSNLDGSVFTTCEVEVQKAPDHRHSMRYFECAESTCTQDGHVAYYLCTDCGCRFADETGNTLYESISAYLIPARHNKLIFMNMGQHHVQRCKCGAELPDTKKPHVDENADEICDICNLPTRISEPVVPTEPDLDQQDEQPQSVLPVILTVVGVGVAILAFILIKRRIRGY
jgi:hypothetical protein